MKKLFYIGLLTLAVFEILKVYLIMPMPGSQQIDSLSFAYFLHSYRWFFRGFAIVLIVVGATAAFRVKHFWIPALLTCFVAGIFYFFNFEMLADKMFLQPGNLSFKSKEESILTDSSIVVGVEYNGEAKAYPIRYMSYHHQVKDTIGGKPMIITYCNVCRTGRVFEPLVDNKPETFRLVGMDHFNAMFEDNSTQSWWRQATGESVAGPLRGKALPEVESVQLRLKMWFELYPDGVVMQPDLDFRTNYDSTGRFEKGISKGKLTRTDSVSWKDKSWVVGIFVNGESKAYDWFQLKKERVINDVVGGKPIVLAVADDDQSFIAFERPTSRSNFTINRDTLRAEALAYNFAGRNLMTLNEHLPVIKSYQEFWHSWRTFHPATKRYE
ncbi:MAG: DUF3179 domain-containing (seleno)protein [Chryseolinea sp.]